MPNRHCAPLVLLSLLTATALAGEALYPESTRSKPAPVFEFRSVRITDSPDCRKGTCAAAKKALVRSLSIAWQPGSGNPNPATLACRQLKGHPAIYFTEKRSQISACEFDDGSFLVTWDLLNRIGGKIPVSSK